jgi:hypothetical protein
MQYQQARGRILAYPTLARKVWTYRRRIWAYTFT